MIQLVSKFSSLDRGMADTWRMKNTMNYIIPFPKTDCFSSIQDIPDLKLFENLSQNFGEWSLSQLISENEIISTAKGEAEHFDKKFLSNTTIVAPINSPMLTVIAVLYITILMVFSKFFLNALLNLHQSHLSLSKLIWQEYLY